MAKIEITETQKQQFNLMLSTLRRISKAYQTSDKIRRDAQKEYGLDFEEAIEYAYDNIQGEAGGAIKGVRAIK